MSHILDALRKAQDETAGKSRSSVTGSETLIARRGSGAWGGMTGRVWIMIGSGVALLVVVGWFLYGPASRQTQPAAVAKDSKAAPATPVLPTPPPAVQAPLMPAPAAPQGTVPVPATPAAPAAVPAPVQQSAPVETTVKAAPAPAPSEDGDDEGGSRHRRRRAKSPAPVAAAPSAAAAPVSAAADATPAASSSAAATPVAVSPEGIKLTGIAWQDSRKLRRAVVNDVLVGEGMLVAGAKVVEIRPTAVRFEKNGSVFDVPLLR